MATTATDNEVKNRVEIVRTPARNLLIRSTDLRRSRGVCGLYLPEGEIPVRYPERLHATHACCRVVAVQRVLPACEA